MFRIVRGQCLRFITQILRHQVAVSNEKATICIFSGLNIKAAHVRTYSSEKNEHQIYQGPLASQIRLVKLFSLGSSIAGLALQPILYNQVQTAPGFAVYGMIGAVGFFTFVTPILLNIVTKKYVINVTFDPDKEIYTAETLTFFLRKRKLEFKPEDVKVPDIPGMFTSMLIKDVPLFMDPRMFPNPDHYIKIMGYDKPIDFKLSLKEEKEGKESK